MCSEIKLIAGKYIIKNVHVHSEKAMCGHLQLGHGETPLLVQGFLSTNQIVGLGLGLDLTYQV